MNSREYIRILLRIALLVLLVTISCWSVLTEASPVRIIFAIGFTVLVVIDLFWYLLRWRKRVQTVLISFEAGDPTGIPLEHDQLTSSLERISQRLRATRSVGEANQIYLELLVKHLEVAVLCLDDRQQVVLANDAFYELVEATETRRLTDQFWRDHWLAMIIQGPDSQDQSVQSVPEQGRSYAIRRTSFSLENRTFELITVADIDTELKKKEQQAWQELLGILTHEIMNSIAPVSSLSQSLEERMMQAKSEEFPQDWLRAVQAIRNRSETCFSFRKTTES